MESNPADKGTHRHGEWDGPSQMAYGHEQSQPQAGKKQRCDHRHVRDVLQRSSCYTYGDFKHTARQIRLQAAHIHTVNTCWNQGNSTPRQTSCAMARASRYRWIRRDTSSKQTHRARAAADLGQNAQADGVPMPKPRGGRSSCDRPCCHIKVT